MRQKEYENDKVFELEIVNKRIGEKKRRRDRVRVQKERFGQNLGMQRVKGREELFLKKKKQIIFHI